MAKKEKSKLKGGMAIRYFRQVLSRQVPMKIDSGEVEYYDVVSRISLDIVDRFCGIVKRCLVENPEIKLQLDFPFVHVFLCHMLDRTLPDEPEFIDYVVKGLEFFRDSVWIVHEDAMEDFMALKREIVHDRMKDDVIEIIQIDKLIRFIFDEFRNVDI